MTTNLANALSCYDLLSGAAHFRANPEAVLDSTSSSSRALPPADASLHGETEAFVRRNAMEFIITRPLTIQTRQDRQRGLQI